MKTCIVILSALLVLALLVYPTALGARTWYILPDGTGDAPTIQAGIDSATAGDIVEVACGAYYEHDIVMKSGVTLRSETGEYDCVTIDAQQQGRIFYCSALNSSTEVVGFTITGGSSYDGAGMYCTLETQMAISHCHFTRNESRWATGIACVLGSSPSISFTVFSHNETIRDGGGVGCSNSFPHIVNCTFFGNSVFRDGAGVFCQNGAHPIIENCIFVDCISHYYPLPPVWCLEGADVDLVECCFYGVDDIYWTGCMVDQIGINGNFIAEPGFCDAENNNFRLCSDSWCMPGTLPNGQSHGLIGAFGEGCGDCGPHVAGVQRTWGGVKALYQ